VAREVKFVAGRLAPFYMQCGHCMKIAFVRNKSGVRYHKSDYTLPEVAVSFGSAGVMNALSPLPFWGLLKSFVSQNSGESTELALRIYLLTST
jgi:hypothetical protein